MMTNKYPEYDNTSEYIVIMEHQCGRMMTIDGRTCILTYSDNTYHAASVNNWDADLRYTGDQSARFSDILNIFTAAHDNTLRLLDYNEDDMLWERKAEVIELEAPKEDPFENTPEDTYLRHFTY